MDDLFAEIREILDSEILDQQAMRALIEERLEEYEDANPPKGIPVTIGIATYPHPHDCPECAKCMT